MKYSIRTKFFLAIGITVLVFIITLALFHVFFYEDYALYQNKKQLTSVYDSINEEIRETGAIDEIGLSNLQSNLGVNIVILGPDFSRKYGTVNEYMWSEYLSMFSQFNEQIAKVGYITQDMRLIDKVNEFEFHFLFLLGVLESGDYIVLNTPMPAIEANIEYSRFFILIAGLITVVIALVVAYFVSGRFSKPLVQINTITNYMTHLDFSHKYSGKNTDEIGELGSNINCLSDQLESTIKQLQMSNVRLEQEVQKSQKIDEMRQSLIANISHDLKTPLAIIQGYAEGLKENISESEEDRDFYCNVIIEEAERMNKLVRQILNLSQLELGTVKPEMDNIEIRAFVDAIYEKFNLIFSEKEIEAFNEVMETIVIADVDMLSQVFVNLITNATDHTPPGGKIITSCDYHDNKIRVYVYNEGSHLDEEELEKVWLSFYKVDKARTRTYGGTGLGLTIVKTIIEAHNNRYGAENRDDGVVFWFELDIG